MKFWHVILRLNGRVYKMETLKIYLTAPFFAAKAKIEVLSYANK